MGQNRSLLPTHHFNSCRSFELLKAFPADIRKVCVCPHALRKLRTYDAIFANDA